MMHLLSIFLYMTFFRKKKLIISVLLCFLNARFFEGYLLLQFVTISIHLRANIVITARFGATSMDNIN